MLGVVMSKASPGHVYVVAGDLKRLVCDAWLLPTDRVFQISDSFADVVGAKSKTRLQVYDWGDGRVVRFGEAESPQVWLGDVGTFDKPPQWTRTSWIHLSPAPSPSSTYRRVGGRYWPCLLYTSRCV